MREVYLLRNVSPSLDGGASTYVTTTLWEYPDDAAAENGFDLVERRPNTTFVLILEQTLRSFSPQKEGTIKAHAIGWPGPSHILKDGRPTESKLSTSDLLLRFACDKRQSSTNTGAC